MILRGFRYKVQPTAMQEALFRQFSGVCRLVYNLALEQRRDWGQHYERETGSKLTYVAQARELTVLRAEYDWIAAVSQTCQQQALRDLDKSFRQLLRWPWSLPLATPKRRPRQLPLPGSRGLGTAAECQVVRRPPAQGRRGEVP
jgi:putative transposase